MYFLANDKNKKELLKHQRFSKVAKEALENGAYNIYLKKDGFNVIFIAFLIRPIAHISDVIKVVVDVHGEFKDVFTYDSDKVAFAYYLMEKEEDVIKLGEEAFRKLYSSLGEDFCDDMLLDEKTRKKKIKLREKFIYFVEDENLSDYRENNEEEKYTVIYTIGSCYEFFTTKKPYLDVTVTIINNEGRKRTIGKMSYFLNAFSSGLKFEQNGLTIYTGESYYSPLDYKILTLFAKNNEATYSTNCQINAQIFLKFLLLYKGQNIIFDNKSFHIDEEEIEEEFILDENSKFIYPRIDYSLAVDQYIIEFNSNHIYLHKFKDFLLSHLANHLNKYKEDEIRFIKDLIIKEAKKSSNFKINISDGYSINLYVDLIDGGTLTFETKFIFNDEEISKEKYLEIENNTLIYEHFKDELDKICGIENGEIKDEGKVLTFLGSDYNLLSSFASLYFSSSLKSLKQVSVPSVNVSIKYENDFLGVDFDMEDISKEEMGALLNAYRHKKKFFLVKNKLIKLPDQNTLIDSLLEFSDDYGVSLSDVKEGKVPKYAYFSLASLKDNNLKIKQDKFIDDFVDKLSNYDNIELTLTPMIKGKMRPYQEKGIKWLKALYQLGLGAILADDMGLGKSLQTVGLISEIKDDRPMLIICPKSVTYNWANEIALWGNNEEVVVLTDNKNIREDKIKNIQNDKRIIYITSYDSLRNDLELYNEKEFSLLVADEAQFIKNAYAKKAQAIKTITADFKLALTGTPIENSLADLWSIFDLIMKGYLSSFKNFKAKYIDNDEMLEKLRKKVAPFILRRVKNDVLKDLPKKEVIVQTLSMSEEERKIYNVTLLDARHKLEEAESSFSMLPILTNLREICVDPMIFYHGFDELSTKFNFVMAMIKEGILAGHKFLIFSSFASVLHHFETLLKKEEIQNRLIDGQVKAVERIEFANEFNESELVNVMLVSLKAGGTGLNLHGADIVIHLDPWWNFASEEQATDRAHRIGQKRPVTVYKLIMHNSIEEKVMKLQEMKKELNGAVIGIDKESASKITKEDIKYLLS